VPSVFADRDLLFVQLIQDLPTATNPLHSRHLSTSTSLPALSMNFLNPSTQFQA